MTSSLAQSPQPLSPVQIAERSPAHFRPDSLNLFASKTIGKLPINPLSMPLKLATPSNSSSQELDGESIVNHPEKAIPLASNSTDKAIGAVTLDLLSLNVWGLIKPLGTDIKARSVRIGKSLSEFDIVGLQETFSKDTNAIYDTARAGGTHFHRFRPTNRFITNSGLTNLSKYPILKEEFVPFKYAAHADALAKKGVAFTRVDVPGIGPVDIYNTHYQAQSDGNPNFVGKLMMKLTGFFLPGFDMPRDLIRIHDNQTLIKFVKDNEQGYPTFVMGDFNTKDHKSLYHNLLRELNLKDSFREANPNDPGYTSDGKTNPYKDNVNSRNRIDYLFYKPGQQVDVKLTYSTVAFDKPIEGKVVSDHYGVHSRFDLTPAKKSLAKK